MTQKGFAQIERIFSHRFINGSSDGSGMDNEKFQDKFARKQ